MGPFSGEGARWELYASVFGRRRIANHHKSGERRSGELWGEGGKRLWQA